VERTFGWLQRCRRLLALPEQFKRSEEAKFLASIAQRHAYNIVHLIYRPKDYEGPSKDYEFSRWSMEEHWREGYNDTVHTLRHPEVLERHGGAMGGVATFDLTSAD